MYTFSTPLRVAVVANFAFLLAVAAGTARPTAPSDRTIFPAYYNELVDKSSVGNYVNKSNRLAICNVRTKNTTCAITAGRSATRTIELSMGASREFVASGLSVSSAATQTIEVSCTSPRMNPGANFVAYPLGRRYTYKIRKHLSSGYRDVIEGTSGWLHAFNPYASGISCGVQ